MINEIKLRMTNGDLDKAAGILSKTRGKVARIPRPLLAKLVCDYGALFKLIERERLAVKEIGD